VNQPVMLNQCQEVQPELSKPKNQQIEELKSDEQLYSFAEILSN
jgi:hypothetical protein